MRELWNLGWVGGLTAIGFLSVYTARQNEISSASLTYAGVFLAVFGLAHIGVRAGLPNADPWLLPLAALLCALGLTEIYRLSPTLARDQSVWVVIGLLGFLAMIFLVRDHRRLEPYTSLLATTAVVLLGITMVVGTTVNGAKLWLRFGGVQVQPGEFAKLLLVVFLASYLREHREVLTMAHRRILGVGLPAARHLGPLALMAGISLGVLAVMDKDKVKTILAAAGIECAKSVTFREHTVHDVDVEAELAKAEIGVPCFVKPARLGSSVGISKVTGIDGLRPALDLAFQHDSKVLVEEMVPGIEAECGVLGNHNPMVSVVGRLHVNADWYDYSAKYEPGGMDLEAPADLPEEVTAEVQRVALLAFDVCECAGMTLTTPAEHPYGSGRLGSKYQGQAEPTPSRYHLNFTP